MAVTVAELRVVAKADTTHAEAGLSALDRRLRDIVAGGLMVGLGKSMLDFTKDFITAGAAFEQQFVLIDRLAGGTGAQVQELQKLAFQLDQSMIFGADQVAQSMEQLARESFTAEQMLDGAAEAALNFAGAVDEDVAQSANFFGNVARVFREEGLSFAEVSDILTQAVLRSGRPLAEMATGFQYVGAAASTLGVPLRDTMTALTLLGREGVKVRSAGTGLRTMFLELADPAVRQELSLLGITVTDLEGNFLGLEPIVEQFGKAIAGMNDLDALAFLEGIFGRYAAAPLLTLFRRGIDGWNETEEAMESAGGAADMMNARMDTVAGSIDRLSATALNLKRIIGAGAGNIFRPLIDGATVFLDFISNLPAPILAVTGAIIGITGALFLLGGAMKLFSGLGGFGLIAAAAAAVTPVALLTGALVGLAIVFKEPLSEGISEASDRINEFFSDLTKVYDRIREPTIAAGGTGDGLLGGIGFHKEQVGQIEAGTRAIGSAIEDLTGIENSAFFARLGQRLQAAWDDFITRLDTFRDDVVERVSGIGSAFVEGFRALFLSDLGWNEAIGVFAANVQDELGTNLTSAIVNALQLAGDVVRGDWDAAWEDLKDLAIDVGVITVDVAGWVLGKALDLDAWIGNLIFGGGFVEDESPRGYHQPQKSFAVGVGEILVEGFFGLGAELLTRVDNFWEWIKGKILGTGDGITLPNAKVSIEEWIKGTWPDVQAWLEERLEEAGVEVTFDKWKLNIVAPSGEDINVDMSGLVDWVKDLPTLGGLTNLNNDMFNAGDDLGQKIGRMLVTGLIFGIPKAIAAVFVGVIGIGSFAFGLVGGALWGAIQELIDQAGTFVRDKIGDTDVTEWIENSGVGDAIYDFFAGIPGAIATILENPPDVVIAEGIAGGISWLVDLMWSALGVPAGEDPVMYLGGKLSETLQSLFGSIGDMIGGLIKGGPRLLPIDQGGGAVVDIGLTDALLAAVHAAIPATAFLDELLGWIKDGYQALVDWIDAHLNPPELPEWVRDPLGWLKGELQGAQEEVEETIIDPGTGEEVILGKRPMVERDLLLGDEDANPLSGMLPGMQLAAAAITTITLGIESRITAFAGVITTMAFNAGDGFFAGISQGFQKAGAAVTNITIGLEARAMAFAGAITTAGFNAGDGFASGLAQGMIRAQQTVFGFLAMISISVMFFSLYDEGYGIGLSLGAGIAAGISASAWMVGIAAANAISAGMAFARLVNGIFSPSARWAEEIGVPLGQGVAMGIGQAKDDVENAVASLTAPPSARAFAGVSPRHGRQPQTVSPQVHVHVHGNVYGDDQTRRLIGRIATEEIVPAFVGAISDQRSALGVP